jgi:hypothetical protein
MERLTRYELGEIKRLHDKQRYRSISREYLASQLARIGLSSNASRFDVADKVGELERGLNSRLVKRTN